jgi:hemolysin activation/secretion protein
MGESASSTRPERLRAPALAAAVLLILAGTVPAARAQTAAGGRGGTIEQENRALPGPLSSPLGPLDLARPADGPPAVADLRFAVGRIDVEGVTVLPKAEVDAVVDPLEGREISAGELFAAADRITALYARAGYALSFALVPVQEITGGVVRLMVIEGQVGRISVEVKGGGALVGDGRIVGAVTRRAQALRTGRPVRSAELERVLLTLADLPGVKPTATFRASADTAEGASDITITVEVDPLTLQLGGDNRLREDFGAWRYSGRAGARSVALFGDELSLAAQRSVDGGAFAFEQVAYQAPVGGSGLTANAAYSQARTKATRGTLGRVDFAGEEAVARLGLSYPLVRTRNRNLTLSAQGAAIDSASGLFGRTLIKDRVRTLEADLTYDWIDGSGAVSLAGLGVEQGIAGLGASARANPLASRLAGTPDFTAVSFRLRRDQPAGGLVVRAEADGQATVAGGALAPVECVYGGERLGRGYDAGAIGGDHCLRAALSVGRPMMLTSRIRLEPFAYADAAIVRQAGTLEAGERREASAASVGGGLRLSLPSGLAAELLVSAPLQGRYAQTGSDPRAFLSLGYRW